MADSPIFPGNSASPLTPDGQWRGEWFRYLRALAKQPGISSDQSAAIAALTLRIQALEGGESDVASIQGLLSVIVSGTLADGLVQLSLAGDEAAPDPSHYYGTDDAGAKGFHPFPAFDNSVPYAIPSSETYTIHENKQAPFTIPIDIGPGSGLIVEGILVEVD